MIRILKFRNVSIATAVTVLWSALLIAAPQDRSLGLPQGTRIHYLEEGSGEPVVLLHGYASNATTWIRNGVFPGLAKRYHVIALDCRGHGASDKPHEVNYDDQDGARRGCGCWMRWVSIAPI